MVGHPQKLSVTAFPKRRLRRRTTARLLAIQVPRRVFGDT